MGLFAKVFRAEAPAPISDYWFNPVGAVAASGIRVTPESALKVSAVWACVGLIAETVASLPLILYRRREDGGRDRATGHPLYTLLHDQPNRWQTAYEFKEMLTAHVLLRGNAYAEIRPGSTGPISELVPLHPDHVTPERLPTGAVRYRVVRENGQTDILNDENVFHLRARSPDGLRGLSVIEHAREAIGLALATESHGARVFSQRANPGGVLTHKGTLSTGAQKRLREQFLEQHAGLNNAHGVLVLEEGMAWQQIGMTNEDAQFLLTREFQVEDIARWFRVPLHMISSTTKTTSWGTGIEHQSLGFVIYTLMAHLRRWEQTIWKDLIAQPGTFFAEFLLDGLLRGDVESRYRAYATARQWGWLSVDDIRERENMNPLPDGRGQVYLEPLNMQEAGTARRSRPLPEPEPSRDALARGHYLLLLHEAASAVVRKEVAALSKAAKKHADDPAGWAAAVEEFYAEHVGFVQAKLRVPKAVAEEYCAEQRAALLAGGASVMEDWEIRRVGDLMALAQGGQDERADE
jgi:HK97 family phage portal protein